MNENHISNPARYLPLQSSLSAPAPLAPATACGDLSSGCSNIPAAPLKAQIAAGEVPVEHSIREDVGFEFLGISVPDGWDDVKKLTKKVLLFDGRKFTFCGWNSDTLRCTFRRPLDGAPASAKIVRR